MENIEKTSYTTEEYYDIYGDNIKVNFNVDYISTQPSGSSSCSAHAEAMMLSMFYDMKFPALNFWNNANETSGGIVWQGNEKFVEQVGIEADKGTKLEYVYNLNYYKDETKYYNQIKQYLDAGIPVEICIDYNNDETRQTHYITIIGYRGECVGIDDLLMVDPATSDKDKKIRYVSESYDELYKYDGSEDDYWKQGFHLVTPNIIFNGTEYVLDASGNIVDIFERDAQGDIEYDENGWPKHLDEPKEVLTKQIIAGVEIVYVDPNSNMPYDLKNGDLSYNVKRAIIGCVENTSMPRQDKDRIIEQLIKVFVGTVPVISYVKDNNCFSDYLEKIHSITNTASTTRYDPLILDLDGDGFNIEKKEDGANFDLFAESRGKAS